MQKSTGRHTDRLGRLQDVRLRSFGDFEVVRSLDNNRVVLFVVAHVCEPAMVFDFGIPRTERHASFGALAGYRVEVSCGLKIGGECFAGKGGLTVVVRFENHHKGIIRDILGLYDGTVNQGVFHLPGEVIHALHTEVDHEAILHLKGTGVIQLVE